VDGALFIWKGGRRRRTDPPAAMGPSAIGVAMFAHIIFMIVLVVFLVLYFAACFGVSPRAMIHHKLLPH
jgi:hypothetical protein